MEKIAQIANASFFFALALLILSFTFKVWSGNDCCPKKFHGGKCGKMRGHHDMMMFEVDDGDFDIAEHLSGLDLPKDILEKIKDVIKDIEIEISAEDGEEEVKVIVKAIATEDD